ncbi:MAG: ribbon-helix-helix domain-containing protein [Candidatus Bathyarchaeia archaeon]
MKSLRISDEVHERLTALLGELTAQTKKMQTYQDAIESLLSQSVVLPEEMLEEVERFLEENRHLGFSTREEFIRHAIRYTLRWESGDYEYIAIPREKYHKLSKAVRETGEFSSASDYIMRLVDDALERYEDWRRSRP